ncbi:hypothetical protein P691DRAFT_282853 [Macrolepiota fuliginosa MF-IS2]|uniref:DUF6533 domain-containing protein n=1 Tax=Macrolepiota fuliginosa MF-IS2 TaxID=1400762 RepID=A0A9P5X9E4_9AGAR|nr:hypothetical protein P691DRAFT_282853 [Macrolepiota fuliginosa MF-IS2]
MAIPNSGGKLSFAVYTFFLYEYVHFLPNEIEDIWLSKWDGRRWIVNCIYVICRYTTFFDFSVMIYDMTSTSLVNGELCLGLGIARLWVIFVGLECAQFAFFLRAYALWQDVRVAKLCLIFLTTGLFVAGITLNVLIMDNATVPPALPGNSFIPSCLLTEPNGARLSMWGTLTMLIFDSILMVMAIGAKIKFRYTSCLNGTNTLMGKVYHDAIYYFVLNFLISLTSILIYDECPGPLKLLTGAFWGVAMRCLSCRVLLRLKRYNQPSARSVTRWEIRDPI